MNPFKKNDIVECTRHLKVATCIQYGEQFTILKIDEDYIYYRDGFSIHYQYAKLITKGKMMQKSELKTGMLVRTGDKRLRLVLGNTLISLSDSGGGIGLDNYNDNLKTSRTVNDEIIEIYTEPKGNPNLGGDMHWWIQDEHFLEYCTRLWIKPDPVQELTLEEISKRLGYEVKIIKGK